MEKIKTIVLKEWSEIFKNRFVLLTVLLMPLVLTIIPLVSLASITGAMSAEVDSFATTDESSPDAFTERFCPGDFNQTDCLQVYMINLFTLMFMIMPVAIPVTIAAYSIVGEKTNRSLEPLLATPLTTVELIVAKILAAAIPALLATWTGFTIYVIALRLMMADHIFRTILDPMWWMAIFILGPLFTLLAISVAIMISSRVSDPRIAEQISALVILPIILLMVGQSMNLIIINRTFVIIMIIAAAILDTILIFLSFRIFQRESILTRWK
ncbi:MAG: ABC transporter permease subunit [Chloroflexi bacterium]|nr:ABC transporter permease subunit [Chloroflexota bacterium]MBP8059495.1 ABC transporter permease subunit [Chloroflexota bacterium]